MSNSQTLTHNQLADSILHKSNDDVGEGDGPSAQHLLDQDVLRRKRLTPNMLQEEGELDHEHLT